VPPPKEAPPVKVAAFNQFKRKSSFSIGGAMKKKEQATGETEKVEDYSNKPRTSFTLEQLKAKWKSYAYQVQKQKRIRVYAALAKRDPELKDNFEVVFTIDNSAQEESLENERTNLLSFLRKELNNYGISLTIKLTEKEESTMEYSSGKDRFKQMQEKNAVLEDLRKKLGLDIEY